jgi:hypothetical protein
MLTRKQVIEALNSIPDEKFDASMAIEEIILLDKVEKALEDLKSGKVISDEDLDKEIEKW